MASTGFAPYPEWHWPQQIPTVSGSVRNEVPMPGVCMEEEEQGPSRETRNPTLREKYRSNVGAGADGASVDSSTFNAKPAPVPTQRTASRPASGPAPNGAKYWPPRTCRICLQTVQPTYPVPPGSIPDILQPPLNVTYDSEDPDSGRLLRPCKCKGTSKYVHEGCLRKWRYADPGFAKRNYWQCPTCGFRYRLERIRWASWISSITSQIILTIAIFFLAMFLFGFIADPVINIYLDPYSAISSASIFRTKLEPLLTDDEVTSWPEHFMKGLAAIGLLSFVKFLFALSPWQWWNVRHSGILSGNGRIGGNGRDRLASIGWVVVLVGVGTFLWVSEGPKPFQYRLMNRRLCINLSVRGAVEFWKKLGNLSWMWLLLLLMMMMIKTNLMEERMIMTLPYRAPLRRGKFHESRPQS